MVHSSTVSDEELVRAAQLGGLEAFNALYERFFPAVYYRVRCVVPEEDVEDVIQEVFIAVMKSLKGFRFASSFKTWLRTLVNRQVANYYRSREPRQEYLDDDLSQESNQVLKMSLDDHLNRDDVIVLYQAIRDLPENYREIILLRFVEGLQFDEIARLNAQSLEATKSLFRRAITALTRRVQYA